MYKKLRKRIKASRPIAKRQKVLNIALLAIALASVAVFLWSVANVARAKASQEASPKQEQSLAHLSSAEKMAVLEEFISTSNPLHYNGEGEIPYHIRYEMLELLTKCYGELKANQLVFLLESKQMSFGTFSSHIQACLFMQNPKRSER